MTEIRTAANNEELFGHIPAEERQKIKDECDEMEVA
jgi:hypothetical protein